LTQSRSSYTVRVVANLSEIEHRAALHAALGEPVRLAIVDELAVSDRAPAELGELVGLNSNLLAFHLDVLERAGLISRTRSSGDGRRRYIRLLPDRFDALVPGRRLQIGPVVFVCTRNSARSQLAAALWRQLTHEAAESAGTHPATAVHPGAMRAARRAGLDLSDARPRALEELGALPDLVVTVCDRAHEELEAPAGWLHWSVPDPVVAATGAAFDAAVAELRDRIAGIVERGAA
jgi:protein-tyrosine-phosphatase/DNA-binding HxlR family transcriptional regulator